MAINTDLLFFWTVFPLLLCVFVCLLLLWAKHSFVQCMMNFKKNNYFIFSCTIFSLCTTFDISSYLAHGKVIHLSETSTCKGHTSKRESVKTGRQSYSEENNKLTLQQLCPRLKHRTESASCRCLGSKTNIHEHVFYSNRIFFCQQKFTEN